MSEEYNRKKQKEMRTLKRHIKKKIVDEDFIPYLKRMNKYVNVCTTQCCTGESF